MEGGGDTRAEPSRLRILFCLWAINYDRVFEQFVDELLRRGHSVHVLLEGTKPDLPVGAGESFRDLAEAHDGRLTRETLPARLAPRDIVARLLRRIEDYLRYLEPEYAQATALRRRVRRRLPAPAAALLDLLGSRPWPRSRLRALAAALDRALPLSAPLVDAIRGHDPDVVLVAPLIMLGSPQSDVVPAAASLGVPAVLPVASWDNLTNKGLVRSAPARTIVWNEDQVEEAVRLHGLPRESVVAVGAHAFDHWFGWEPSTTAAEFAGRVGLDPERPFVLYACSSAFVAGDETPFVRDWLGRLRARGGALANVGVLVRPHPQNVRIWEDVDLGGGAVVWPRGGEVPTDAQRKADYYDSLYHSCAMVGINTSALVESAIVRRPVFTILTDRYRATQDGTLHFEHLTGGDGRGVLNVARSWDEHLDQLADAIEHPDRYEPRIEAFLHRFVRPHGLDQAAAPRAADVVEEAARLRPRIESSPAAARAVVSASIGITHARLWAAARTRGALRRDPALNR